jgi:hypothetical protein
MSETSPDSGLFDTATDQSTIPRASRCRTADDHRVMSETSPGSGLFETATDHDAIKRAVAAAPTTMES